MDAAVLEGWILALFDGETAIKHVIFVDPSRQLEPVC